MSQLRDRKLKQLTQGHIAQAQVGIWTIQAVKLQNLYLKFSNGHYTSE